MANANLPITKTQLVNASTDAETWEHIVNDSADNQYPGLPVGTVQTRLGLITKNVARAILDIVLSGTSTDAGLEQLRRWVEEQLAAMNIAISANTGQMQDLLNQALAAKNDAGESASQASDSATSAESSKDLAAQYYEMAKQYVESITNMTVTAVTLPYNQPATASWNAASGELELGIPAGIPGPEGMAPALDVIDCGYPDTEWISVIDGGEV